MAELTATAEESSVVRIPHGMTEVSREVFWQHVMAETRNVNPSSEKFETHWMLVAKNSMWGWSSRGWLGPFDWQGAPPERYALATVKDSLTDHPTHQEPQA